MASRLRYFVYVGALACAVIGVAYIPPSEYRGRIQYGAVMEPEQAVRLRAERHLIFAEGQLEVLRLRDFVLQRISGSGVDLGAGSPIVVAQGRVPDTLAGLLEATAREVWEESDRRIALPLVVAVVIDTTTEADEDRLLRRYSYLRFGSFFILPQMTGDRACIAVYVPDKRVLDVVEEGRITKSALPREDLLGVCRYYAAFGLPGEEIREWLGVHRHMIVTTPAWSERSRRTSRARRWTPWPANLIACSHGDALRCRSTVLPPESETPQSSWTRMLLFRDAIPAYTYRYARSDHRLGPNAATFMSDLVFEMGYERFADFWQSDLPVDVAFQGAFGVSIEEWTMRWARAQIGERRIGPMVPLPGAGSSLLMAGLLVGISVLVARRRAVQ